MIASASPGHGRGDRRPRTSTSRPRTRRPNADLHDRRARQRPRLRQRRLPPGAHAHDPRGGHACAATRPTSTARPAAVALALHHGEDCGVSFVATVPQARRHGLATQVMRSALADAVRHDLTTITLQATELGERLYQQLGLQAARPDGAVGAPPMSLNPALEDVHHCPRCGQDADGQLPALDRRALPAGTPPSTTRSRSPARSHRHAEGHLILMRRGFEPRRGHWSMPGGFVDLGESVEHAAIREVQEELNLQVELTHLIGVYSRAEDRTVVVVYAATTHGHSDPHRGGARGSRVRADRYPMAGPGLLERQERAERPPRASGRLKARALLNLRRALALVLVFAATCAGGYLALVSYHDGAELSVGEIRMSIDPGHRGALDVYVPLVDWGARFEAIRAPVRLRVDLQTVDRHGRARPGRGRVAGRQPRPQRRPRGAHELPAAADRADRGLLARARAARGLRDPLARAAAALDGVARGPDLASGSASRWSC